MIVKSVERFPITLDREALDSLYLVAFPAEKPVSTLAFGPRAGFFLEMLCPSRSGILRGGGD
jgi:hypothetical protein